MSADPLLSSDPHESTVKIQAQVRYRRGLKDTGIGVCRDLEQKHAMAFSTALCPYTVQVPQESGGATKLPAKPSLTAGTLSEGSLEMAPP